MILKSVEKRGLKDDEILKCKMYNLTFGEYPLMLKVKIQLKNAGNLNAKFTIDITLDNYNVYLEIFENEIQLSKEDKKYLSSHLFYLYCKKASRIFYNGIIRNDRKSILAKNLKWLRQYRGYSLEKGAVLLGMDSQALKNVEEAKLPMKEVRKVLNFDLINKTYSIHQINLFNYLWFLKKVKFLCVRDVLQKEGY